MIRYMTSDDGRFGVDLDLVPTIIADLERYPRRFIQGCRRDEMVCIGPGALCRCCQQYERAHGYRSYPDDGKGHVLIIRDGHRIEAWNEPGAHNLMPGFAQVLKRNFITQQAA